MTTASGLLVQLLNKRKSERPLTSQWIILLLEAPNHCCSQVGAEKPFTWFIGLPPMRVVSAISQGGVYGWEREISQNILICIYTTIALLQWSFLAWPCFISLDGAQFKLLHHPRLARLSPYPKKRAPSLQQLSALVLLLILDFRGFWHQPNTPTHLGTDTHCIGSSWSQAQVAAPLQRVRGDVRETWGWRNGWGQLLPCGGQRPGTHTFPHHARQSLPAKTCPIKMPTVPLWKHKNICLINHPCICSVSLLSTTMPVLEYKDKYIW